MSLYILKLIQCRGSTLSILLEVYKEKYYTFRLLSTAANSHHPVCLCRYLTLQQSRGLANAARLKFKDLVFCVAQLFQNATQVALIGRGDFGSADGLVQAWRSTDKDLDVVALGVGDHGLEQLLVDNSRSVFPARGRGVEGVKGTESIGEVFLELGQLIFHKNILLGQIAKYQGHLCLVFGVLEDGADQLEHGCDTCAAGDQSDVVVLVGRPGVFRDGTFEGECLAGFQGEDVVGHGAFGVDLDKEVEMAF